MGVAPAIVRADSLMRLVPIDTGIITLDHEIILGTEPVSFIGTEFLDELSLITRRVFVPKMVMQVYKESPMLHLLLQSAQP